MSNILRCGVALSVLVVCAGAAAQPRNLTVISFGGATKQAQEQAYFQPFNQSGAARVVAGEYNGELSKIKAVPGRWRGRESPRACPAASVR